MPGYGEYILKFFETRSQMAGCDLFERVAPNNLPHALLIDGLYAGRWKRTLKRTEVQVTIRADRVLSDPEWALVASKADRFGQFYGLPTSIVR